MLPQGIFSVAVATVLFPRSRASPTRGDMDGFRHTVALGLRQIVFTLDSGECLLRRARRADHAASSTSAARSGRRRRRRGRRARRVLARAHVQRRDADAEPRLLQPAVAVDPDLVALGNLFLNALLAAALYRSGSGASRSRRRSRTSPARRRSSSCSAPPGADRARRDGPRRVASRRSAALRPSPSVWYGLDEALGRSFSAQLVLRWQRAAAARGVLFRAVCWEFASSRRCYRCWPLRRG